MLFLHTKKPLTFSQCSILTTDHFHIAHFPSPSWCTHTLILIFDLMTSRLIFTRICCTPVHIFTTVFTSVTVRTVTGVVSVVILTRCPIQTRWTIAQVYSALTIRTSVSEKKENLRKRALWNYCEKKKFTVKTVTALKFRPKKQCFTYPDGQIQLYELIPSIQVPPFIQLLSVQSSSFVWQRMPEKPSGQVQVYESTYWLHVAPL